MIAAVLVGVARASPDVSILDLLELDMGYTTIADNFYRTAAPQQLLDGARSGIVAYLHGRGVADPQITAMHARSDGRGVVPAIERQLGKAIERYANRVSARELVYSAIRGELGALRDPYSVFFTKAELAGFSTALDGKAFGGIGVVLASDAVQGYRADEVFPGGPAARAGVVVGDRLVAVDGKPVDGLAAGAISALLRGRIGTLVRLDVVRTGDPARRQLTITRAAISPPDVSTRLLPEDVGYLALRAFGPNAGSAVHTGLAALNARGARATIFDLRGNGGGYESAAVRVASAFIASGAIVITQTNRGRKEVTSADGTAVAARPLVILVDHDSASGSELVAGAIADHERGKVVGMRTFGKGLVQTIFPLPDGAAMKVTTARYFTPNGRDIDRVGITPDVVVSEPADAVRGVPGRDPQLDAALALLALQAPSAAPDPQVSSAAPVPQATYR